MAHHCQVFVINCIDFRLQKPIRDYLEKQNLLGDSDIAAAAGGVKDLGWAMKQIEVSRHLHGISQVILIGHTDCGAYGGDDKAMLNDLKKAKGNMLVAFPDMAVMTVLAKLDNLGNIEFINI